MALHGGGHLELRKMHKGDFWGIFGVRLGRCPGIIPEKISFLQFYSRFLCFFSLMLLHYNNNTPKSNPGSVINPTGPKLRFQFKMKEIYFHYCIDVQLDFSCCNVRSIADTSEIHKKINPLWGQPAGPTVH